MDKGCALGPNRGINEEEPPVSQISRFAFDRRSLLGGAASLLAAPALVRAQAKALKIAVLLPRSGLFAQAGQSCHRGALAAPKTAAAYLAQMDGVLASLAESQRAAAAAAEKRRAARDAPARRARRHRLQRRGRRRAVRVPARGVDGARLARARRARERAAAARRRPAAAPAPADSYTSRGGVPQSSTEESHLSNGLVCKTEKGQRTCR
jgi:hypothetical protein